MRSFLTVIIFAILVCGLGCNRGPKKPPGFPPLFPCKVQVTQGGSPLSGADVTLVPVEATGTVWPVGAQTDAAGIAEIRTYGEHIGAPLGTYKVVVSKIEIETIKPGSPPGGAYYVPPVQKIHELVDSAFTSAQTTTLQIEVAKGTRDYSVDVGAAVRITKQQPR